MLAMDETIYLADPLQYPTSWVSWLWAGVLTKTIATDDPQLRQILEGGVVRWSGHAWKEMEKDNLTTVDCTNVLRGGVVEPG